MHLSADRLIGSVRFSPLKIATPDVELQSGRLQGGRAILIIAQRNLCDVKTRIVTVQSKALAASELRLMASSYSSSLAQRRSPFAFAASMFRCKAFWGFDAKLAITVLTVVQEERSKGNGAS